MKAKENIQNRIASVFFDLVKAGGLRKTTMDDVASTLRISKKTIFRHYSSKDELIEGVAARIICDINGIVEHHMMDSRSAVEKYIGLCTGVGAYLKGLNESLLVDLQHQYPELWGRIENARLKGMAAFRSLVEQGVAEGVYREIDARLAAQAIAAAIVSVINPSFLAKYDIPMERALEDLKLLFLDGLRRK